jgi:Nucleotidyltransferase domain
VRAAARPGGAVRGPAEGAAARYLQVADRLVPGRVVGLYVVGSAALGAFRPGRSDVDLVAVVDGEVDLRRLRVLHLLSGTGELLQAVAHRQPPLTGTCNVAFVRHDDLTRPVTEIAPVASHVGHQFTPRAAFDVNPVVWKVLQERGITGRGPAPAELGLDPQPEILRAWNRTNLESYWRPWADRALRRRTNPRPGWTIAWGALGPPRLHHTVATGDVLAKEEAGTYALDTFAGRWHPVIRAGLAYRQHRARDRSVPWRDAARFALAVVEDALLR